MTIACVAWPTAALPQAPPDDRPPTPLEQTLVEHVCDRFQSSSQNADAREQCVGVQFRALRAEFGYEFSRLSTAERARLDSTCSRLRKPENVAPYLNCLTALLVSVREQRHGADGVAPSEVSFGIPSLPVSTTPPAQPSGRWLPIVLTLFGGLAVAAGAAVAVIRLKKRAAANPARVCQRCGEPLEASGDLCSSCRHEAGLAAKQAIADRAAEEKAEQERRKREREQAEERRHQIEAQSAEQQRLEEARLEAERVRQEAAMQAPPPVPIPVVAAIGADLEDAPAEDDPYTILGVPRDASREQIDNAYGAAASKYDVTQVAHLGDAIQAHYRAKAEAIEQAYRTLTAGQLTTS